jgi:tRNA-binding EMAP/Myf-like protein
VGEGRDTSDNAAVKSDETSTADQLDAAVLEAFGPLAADLWVAETLEKRAKAKKPLFEEKLDLEIAKLFRKTVENKLRIARNEELEKLRSADRHLRRSALQLAKAIRAAEA